MPLVYCEKSMRSAQGFGRKSNLRPFHDGQNTSNWQSDGDEISSNAAQDSGIGASQPTNPNGRKTKRQTITRVPMFRSRTLKAKDYFARE